MTEQFKEATILSDEKTSVGDGLENLVASMGTAQDKRSHSRFVNNKRLSDPANKAELDAMYRTDWVSGKVVDIIPDDMTREWRYFTNSDTELSKLMVEEEKRIALPTKFNLAHKWARLYGTSFIVMSIDDGQTPDKPLDLNRLKPGCLKHINVIDRHRITPIPTAIISNPMDKNYGFPELYMFVESTVKIHHSRMLRFDAVMLPFDEFRVNNYFSDSILDRMYDSLTNLLTVTTGASSMVYETNVDIVKVKGLMSYLQSAEGESLIRKRFALASALKSFNNMLLLDNEEDFTTKNNTFSGLDALVDKFAQIVTGAADVPATRLFGTSASGLNATGEGDMKNYYDKLRSLQKQEYGPKLDDFDIIMQKHLGLGDEEDMGYEFYPLFQLTAKEQADVELVRAQRDEKYLDMGIVDEVIIAKELKQDKTYSNITEETIEELEEFLEEIDNELDTDTETNEIENEQAKPEQQSGEEIIEGDENT